MMLCLLLSLAAPVFAGEYSTPDQVLSRFNSEPDVRKVQEMALEYSKTDPHYLENWLAAAKNTNLLPELQATFDYGEASDNGSTWVADPNNADNVYLQPDDLTAKNDWGLQVRAKWRLDKLIMSSERIRVISEAQDIVKLRDKVLEEVTRTYFDRRRLQVEMLLNPGDLKTQLKNELRLEELTAQLDAYTGGRFSAALKRSE